MIMVIGADVMFTRIKIIARIELQKRDKKIFRNSGTTYNIELEAKKRKKHSLLL